MQGINTRGFPLFCRFPLIYKHATKASLFLPSVAFLIQTSFLFGALCLPSTGLFPFLYRLLSLFVFRCLTFFCLWVVSLYRTVSVSQSFFILLPARDVPRIIHHLCFSSPSSSFCTSGPCSLSLILLLPSRCPWSKHPLPTRHLKQLKKRAPKEWNRKDRAESIDWIWEGVFSHVDNFPILCGCPAVSPTVCVCPRPANKANTQGKEAGEAKVRPGACRCGSRC